MSGKTNYEGLSVSATTQNRLSGFNDDPAGNMTQNARNTFTMPRTDMTSASGGYSYHLRHPRKIKMMRDATSEKPIHDE